MEIRKGDIPKGSFVSVLIKEFELHSRHVNAARTFFCTAFAAYTVLHSLCYFWRGKSSRALFCEYTA